MSKKVEWNEEFGTGGTLICTCDQCGKIAKYKFAVKPDYKITQGKLKEKGWRSKKVGDEWFDLCCDECFNEHD